MNAYLLFGVFLVIVSGLLTLWVKLDERRRGKKAH